MADTAPMILYKCTCDRKKIDKSGSLLNDTNIRTEFCLKENCSVLSPVVVLTKAHIEAKEIPLYQLNYAFITQFQRYYFIDDIICLNDGLVELRMSVDVLMTYAGSILASQQEVSRSEKYNSQNFIDTERPVQSNKILFAGDAQFIGNFPESIGANTNNYVLTVAGG